MLAGCQGNSQPKAAAEPEAPQHRAPEASAAPPVANENPRPQPESAVDPVPPAAVPHFTGKPEAGEWFGALQTGDYQPILVRFRIADDGESVEALMLTGSQIGRGWTAITFYFDDTKVSAGHIAAVKEDAELSIDFLSATEARGRARLRMEILKEPDLQMVEIVVAGEFNLRPQRLVGGMLVPGENPLLGKWQCVAANLQTMSLEFHADGQGAANFGLQGKTFSYLYDPATRRLHISDTQGQIELTREGRLSADLRISFVDVLQPNFPTIQVEVKGEFARQQ